MDEADDSLNDFNSEENFIYDDGFEIFDEEGFLEFFKKNDRELWGYSQDEMDYDIELPEEYGEYQLAEDYRNDQYSYEENESENEDSYQEDDYQEDMLPQGENQEHGKKETASFEETVEQMNEFIKYIQNLPTPEALGIYTEEDKGFTLEKRLTIRND